MTNRQNRGVKIPRDDRNLIKAFIFAFIFLGLLISINASTAASNGAYGIKVTNQYIHADGAKCSCSLSDGYYYHHNLTFVNKCPNCGGKLYYECASYWVEGIWACARCDMDFCVVHGKSHDHRGYYLTKTTMPKPEPVVTTPPQPENRVITHTILGETQQLTLKTEIADIFAKI